MAFRWRADDGPTLNSGLVALRFFRGSGPVLLRNPFFLRFFSVCVCGGGGSGPPVPPLDPRMIEVDLNRRWASYMLYTYTPLSVI